jgi:hypothetical protein
MKVIVNVDVHPEQKRFAVRIKAVWKFVFVATKISNLVILVDIQHVAIIVSMSIVATQFRVSGKEVARMSGIVEIVNKSNVMMV